MTKKERAALQQVIYDLNSEEEPGRWQRGMKALMQLAGMDTSLIEAHEQAEGVDVLEWLRRNPFPKREE